MTSDPSRFPTRLVRPAGAAVLAALVVLASGLTVRGQEEHNADKPKLPAAASLKALHAKELAATVCASCHGPTGNSTDPDDPKLAGQKEYYLRLQLRGFKYGARKSDEMSPIAALLSDRQIDEVARFYSRQKVKPDTIKDRQLADLGARIFRYASRGAPACAACHSPGGYGRGMMGGRGGMMGGGGGMMRGGMMGNTAAVPRLFGQHAEYTAKQLDEFASGKRRSTVMSPIAARLSPRDRQAVAEYLAGRR